MQPCHLAVTDLACQRGERLLFRGVNFALTPGQALQIAGPNGIGKSSLIRILAGLMPAYAGAVEREGAIALLDERTALDPHRPLGKALAFWAALDSAERHTQGSAARRLGLTGLLDVPVRYLSTGQRKRAALARLIVQQAPLWLLDEPLNGLDTQAAETVQQLVADHCAQGGIAVIASHQPFLLAAMTSFALTEHTS